ncbi:MAG: UDP-N-acetylmuramate dehydrogenase [Chitinophagaceae bacterium]|nr:UDP-N-acetylmuramate dehydrogenase [Chitinophagaceae bacterium]
MKMLENISLKPYNTFHIETTARYFSILNDADSLQELPLGNQPLMVLGGGSNMLLTKNFDGLVVKNEIMGIELVHEDPEFIYVSAGAGENWHGFVMHCISKGWGGLENLSLIPGSVGASPMQNIGAYGVELEDVFWSLEAWHIQEKRIHTFTKSDCAFGYRESVFKKSLKGKYIILKVTYRLHKKPVFHTSYGAITQELDRMGVTEYSVSAISEAVIRIRTSKLPDPAIIGNAGSFFKNPVVSNETYEQLKASFPTIVAFPQLDKSVKLAAGWLIEQCGWKGYRSGDAGCHASQALVLVNYGNATGKQIYDLSEKILQSVISRFGISLEREVNII